MKKTGIWILSSFLILQAFYPNVVQAVDYAANEDYYSEICSVILRPSNPHYEECQGYADYLQNKVDDLKDKQGNLNNQINEVKADITKLSSVIGDYQKQIDKLNANVEKLRSQINTMNTNLKKLELEIKQKEEDIKIKKEYIVARMRSTQYQNTVNPYLDFIMGASDFIDMINRVSIINQLDQADKEKMDALEGDIKVLEGDKVEIVRQKKLIEAQKKKIDQQIKEVETYKKASEELKREYQSKEAELINQRLQDKQYMQDLINSIPKFTVDDGNLPPSSNGWGKVVSGYRTAGTWYYDGTNSFHPAIDIAGPVGTPITAPINGVIGYTRDGYPTYGQIGSGLGYANMIVMIGEINGRTYGILMGHLMKNGVAVSAGTIVQQGQVIGYRGSSGDSTGPHTHIEIFDLGTVGINGGLNLLQTRGYNFGKMYNESSICGSTPCRVRPENYIPY